MQISINSTLRFSKIFLSAFVEQNIFVWWEKRIEHFYRRMNVNGNLFQLNIHFTSNIEPFQR